MNLSTVNLEPGPAPGHSNSESIPIEVGKVRDSLHDVPGTLYQECCQLSRITTSATSQGIRHSHCYPHHYHSSQSSVSSVIRRQAINFQHGLSLAAQLVGSRRMADDPHRKTINRVADNMRAKAKGPAGALPKLCHVWTSPVDQCTVYPAEHLSLGP